MNTSYYFEGRKFNFERFGGSNIYYRTRTLTYNMQNRNRCFEIICLIFSLAIFQIKSTGQSSYFPPSQDNGWESVTPVSLGWDTAALEVLIRYLDEENTRAFIILKDGKIVVERYFGNTGRNTPLYWASAGKSLTAFVAGLAAEDGYLQINASSSSYLGPGWTSCTSEEELQIKVWHQLTMTSGLDSQVADPDCTLPSCLVCKDVPGTQWNYHNAPYTLLENVIQEARGQALNLYLRNRLLDKTGMSGQYVRVGYNYVFWSRALSMARFGLLMLNEGVWAGDTILTDSSYFKAMIRPSQDINPSYGYLWWLNGQSAFQLPGFPFRFPGFMFPNAPTDMYAALGKNGQILNVIPSMGLVIVRMGDQAETNPIGLVLNNAIWERLLPVFESSNQISIQERNSSFFQIYPNPSDGSEVHITSQPERINLLIYDACGVVRHQIKGGSNRLNLSMLSPGLYFFEATFSNGMKKTAKWVKV
jgi:CubicO group peptidase (beta-lactamase class C family)